jgi:hypothetical protein
VEKEGRWSEINDEEESSTNLSDRVECFDVMQTTLSQNIQYIHGSELIDVLVWADEGNSLPESYHSRLTGARGASISQESDICLSESELLESREIRLEDFIKTQNEIEKEKKRKTLASSLVSSNCTSYRLFKNTKRARLSSPASLD